MRTLEDGVVPGSEIPEAQFRLARKQELAVTSSVHKQYRAWQEPNPVDDPGLFILGEEGTGKTTLGLMAMLYLIDQGVESSDVYYWSAIDYLEDVRQLHRYEDMTKTPYNGAAEMALWKEYQQFEKQLELIELTPVLFIDQVFTIPIKLIAIRFERMLREREGRSLCTIAAVSAHKHSQLDPAIASLLSRNADTITL